MVGWIVLVGCFGSLASAGEQRLELEQIFSGSRYASPLPEDLRWLPDGRRFLSLRNDGQRRWLIEEDAASGAQRRIVDWKAMQAVLDARRPTRPQPPARGAVNAARRWRSRRALSPDGRLLVGLHRGDLYALDLTTGEVRYLTDDPEPEFFPTFSPSGHTLAFVRNRALHLLTLDDGHLRRLSPPLPEGVAQGLPDWVYEEELDMERAFWWSPDSSRIALIEFDTRQEGVFPILDPFDLYAAAEKQRYPKAGTANPSVRLVVFDVATGHPTPIDTGGGGEFYVYRAGWTSDGSGLWYQWLDRHQTRRELRLADPRSGKVRTLAAETDPRWVNDLGAPVFLRDGRFLRLSEADGWRHLYLHAADGSLLARLTHGKWEVRRLYGVDSRGLRALIQGNPGDPRRRELLAVPLEGGEPIRLGAAGGSHEMLLAPGGAWYLETASSLRRPPRLALFDDQGRLRRVVEDGTIEALEELALGEIESLTLEAADGTRLYANVLYPPDFDPSHRYPALQYVYGGPGVQLVVDRWGGSRLLFFHYLAQHGIVVLWLDNRGTPGRGREFERAIDRQLGKIELADQLVGAAYLRSQPWIDAGRMAVYGGSYGGTMTLTALFKAPEVFRAGIAYAPVTDWRLYDTVYTERYMDLPDENRKGYEQGAVLNFAGDLEGRLLLFHGTMDNNVHLYHSLRLIDRLVRAGKDFEVMFYPGVRHGIRVDPDVRLDFHRRKAAFLFRELLPKP